ncbi:structure-specific endonuclease subunit SLX1 [Dendrobium catenatum]|uniref:structure-specific endonuclease subunit SLX1 n=1 Tax=Dendrobium catenatum TaxID=906689 RepID=UPI0009F5C976|nr:structure-specific endonuclease subunit SLX1 [Dendrobium catenatum]
MGRRRGRYEAKEVDEARETEKRVGDPDSDEGADETEPAKGFFACYLLCSLSPRHKGRTYIGFTVNPRRRIKQHNGEKSCGAWRTKRGRPWEMVLCIYGFPSNVSALQFEWAWQHPRESLAVRKAASSFKSLSGLANKIKLAYSMLNLPSWENLNLTVNFFSTKYTKHIAGCPRLPNQMRFNICSMDDLPCYAKGHALHRSSDVFDEADGEEDINEDINMPASADVTIEGMNRNINQMGNTVSYNCEQTLQSTEECYGNLYSNSRILLESSEFTEPSQSPRRVIECRRGASTSLSPNSCSEDSGMDQARQKSTPRSSDNEAMTSSLLLSPKVDVINLCTPSSGVIRSKTKRALFDSIIIDLTDSPMVIQL